MKKCSQGWSHIPSSPGTSYLWAWRWEWVREADHYSLNAALPQHLQSLQGARSTTLSVLFIFILDVLLTSVLYLNLMITWGSTASFGNISQNSACHEKQQFLSPAIHSSPACFSEFLHPVLSDDSSLTSNCHCKGFGSSFFLIRFFSENPWYVPLATFTSQLRLWFSLILCGKAHKHSTRASLQTLQFAEFYWAMLQSFTTFTEKINPKRWLKVGAEQAMLLQIYHNKEICTAQPNKDLCRDEKITNSGSQTNSRKY